MTLQLVDWTDNEGFGIGAFRTDRYDFSERRTLSPLTSQTGGADDRPADLSDPSEARW